MNKRVFDTQNIILLKVDETDLNSFLVDMDLEIEKRTGMKISEIF